MSFFEWPNDTPLHAPAASAANGPRRHPGLVLFPTAAPDSRPTPARRTPTSRPPDDAVGTGRGRLPVALMGTALATSGVRGSLRAAANAEKL